MHRVQTGNLADMLAKVNATNGTYTESAMSFMTPPTPTSLGTLKNRGAKMVVYHGTSDPIFSSDDTTAWYEGLRTANGGDASNFARFFRVPGMNHCSARPSTDQFDMLTPLVNWVEKGEAPDSVLARAREPATAARSMPTFRQRGRQRAAGRCARIRKWRSTRVAAASRTRRTSAASR